MNRKYTSCRSGFALLLGLGFLAVLVATECAAADREQHRPVSSDGEMGPRPDHRNTGVERDHLPRVHTPDAWGSLDLLELSSIIGTDDRVRIYDTTDFPWRTIARVATAWPDGKVSYGTGWFAGPHTVITAGHLVHSNENGGWARSVKVTPAQNGYDMPYGTVYGTKFASVPDWTEREDGDHDYGAIRLGVDLGNTVGWLGFARYSKKKLKKLILNIAGYAGDKPDGTLWYHRRKTRKVTAGRVYYTIDTSPGQSGSPVWRERRGKHYIVVAVHAYGVTWATKKERNSGARITREAYGNLKYWKHDW